MLKKHGVNVPRQGVAETVEEARKVAEVLGTQMMLARASERDMEPLTERLVQVARTWL